MGEVDPNQEKGVRRADEPSSPALSAEPTSRFLAGIDLIRAGEYFAAHEELETAWRAAPAEDRDFFQGLVHVAVAWYQAGRGREIGTERQLAKAIRRLTPYAPEYRGLQLEALLDQLRELHARGSLDLPAPRV
jgi:predicted metal-dependent hydrolase